MQFYFQNGRPAPSELKEQCLIRANQLFYGHADGLQIHGEISQISCLSISDSTMGQFVATGKNVILK